MSGAFSPTRAMACFVAAPLAAADEARRVLKLSVLDWSAVAIAGRNEPVACIVRDMVIEEAGAAQASLIGGNKRVPARAAALANGVVSHALDYDDTHFDYIGHPSVAILPAALAIAEMRDLPGAAFLDAALIGVEVACRIGAWLGANHYQHGFHQTATSGAFGAAAAAARLLGLDEERAAHALGLAATRASGLKSQFGTMGKPYNAGIAASNGVECALLAAGGFVSRPDGIECAQGFAQTHAGPPGGDTGNIFGDFGRAFRFVDVQHKFHACCHGLHAALEALAVARAARPIAAGAIDRVEIFTNPHWLKVCDITAPATGLEAKFSYRLTAAMALAGCDTAALDTYSDGVCRDPGFVALRDRVRAHGDASLNDTSARVRIGMKDGTWFEAAHDLGQTLPIEMREQKVRAKVRAVLSSGIADTLQHAVAALDGGSSRAFAARLSELSYAPGTGKSAS